MKTLGKKPFSWALRGMLGLGPLVLLFVLVFTVRDAIGYVFIALAVALVAVVMFLMSVGVKVGDSNIIVGLFPFYRKQISKSDVDLVFVEEVRPFEDFGGWGVKGRSRKRGLLFSAGETRVVGLRLKDGRRYLVGLGDEADNVAEELRASL